MYALRSQFHDTSFFYFVWYVPIITCLALLCFGENTFTYILNALGQNSHHFADDVFKCIFVNEQVLISLKISLEFVPNVRANNIAALVQTIAWRRPGDKSLSEQTMVSLLMHICVTWHQWVKSITSQALGQPYNCRMIAPVSLRKIHPKREVEWQNIPMEPIPSVSR